MFNANTSKSYDFWYYHSLLEEPYTDLVKYFNTLIYERDKYNVITLAEEFILALTRVNTTALGVCQNITII